MQYEQFDELVRSRRATRHFKSDPVSREVVMRLLATAQWSPSGYNLQPTHYYIVDASTRKEALYRACLDQKQILEAPITVVFCGDRNVHLTNFEDVLRRDLDAEAINTEYERLLRKIVPLAFVRGPMGIGRTWKSVLPPLMRFTRAMPGIPAADMNYWLAKQVSISAMVFMLAAAADGLATCPMEGFDEPRVRRALELPRSMHVVLVVPLGYSASPDDRKTRLPLDRFVHWSDG